jgi:hypothetical protein
MAELKGLFGGEAPAELKGLFGGGEVTAGRRRAEAQDYVQRYMTGDPTEGYSREEAARAFQAAAQNASPEQMRRAAGRAMDHLNPDQRAAFAEMLRRRQAGQGAVPIERAGGTGGGDGGLDDLLGGLLGGSAQAQDGGGGLGDLIGSPIGKAVIGGIAAFALDELLGRDR